MNQRFGIAIALAAVLTFGSELCAAAQGPEQTRYLIQYRAGDGDALRQLIAANGGRVVFDYSALLRGLAADLPPAARQAVRQSGLATRLEQDAVRTLHALPPGFPVDFEEFVGWGPDRVQADVLWSTNPNPDTADDGLATPDVRGSSVTGAGIVVGVLDTGIDYGHPDLAGNVLDRRDDGVVRDFIDVDDDPTDALNDGHGTSTASVIASVDNGVGVVGVAPGVMISPYRVCEETCPISAIIGALVQAVVDEVHVINMSLGGPAGFNLEASAVQAANARGVVVVASAGNDASQQPSFPAAYDTVLAVGATDVHDDPASFTNVGGWVDVTGPGVAIAAATCQGCGRFATLASLPPVAGAFAPEPMEGTGVGALDATPIVDVGPACDSLGVDLTGPIALIVRGTCTFAEKVKNAEDAGAAGTVIYNNVPGNFSGTLGAYPAKGPSVSIAQAEGLALVAAIADGEVLVDLEVAATDYERVDGTSFSAPHVAGVAALVRSVNPELSPIEVRKIIESTAEPIGPKVTFGNGMVRAHRAVEAAQ